MNNQPTLWILVGLPGSGKSTAAARFVKDNPDYIHVSRDVIRFAMLGNNDDYFKYEKAVYKEFIGQIQMGLDSGKNVIADATHLNKNSRLKLLENLALDDYNIGCVYFDCPIDKCLYYNSLREGRARVPDSVILSMNKSLTSPFHDGKNLYDYVLIFHHGDLLDLNRKERN